MMPILWRTAVMVISIRAARQRMMHPAIHHASMIKRHVPGGKEPAKQRQQSEDAVEWTHAAPYPRSHLSNTMLGNELGAFPWRAVTAGLSN